MNGKNSHPGYSDLSDPSDPFYADPLILMPPTSSSTADFITPLDRAVVEALDESGPRAALTFERIGRGAYEGFTVAEARTIAANPDQLAHLTVALAAQTTVGADQRKLGSRRSERALAS